MAHDTEDRSAADLEKIINARIAKYGKIAASGQELFSKNKQPTKKITKSRPK